MNIRNKVFSLFLTLSITLGLLSACGKTTEEPIMYTLDEILSSFSNETNLDELMALNETISLREDDTTKDKDFYESIKQLENYINLIAKFNSLGIEPTPLYTHTIEDTYSDLSPEEVDLLLDSLLDQDLKDVVELRIKTGIGYKHQQYKTWIENNGLKLSEELLKKIVKAATCEVSGLEIKYYNSCTISAGRSNPNSKTQVKVLDPESNASLEYSIDNNTILSDAIKLLYKIQSTESATYDETLSYTIKSLNLAKLAVAADFNLENKNIITCNNNKTEARQYILENK